MYDAIQVCVTVGVDKITDATEEKTGIRQGSNLSYILNVFIDDM